ncbi:hypothetical protein COF46_28490 [Bacillus pseudomycoides]|nr:hypothetical protein CN887_26930 [Bacillus pseudomycoides]PFZ82833.1 hypothetical protein COL70_29120 [Bacillus pseudomycoides]PHD04320.1 hypothetical protein COF46_28490 [Bacillus pseudomycoides]PHG32161.1 hypothetical protein COI43_11985 [Bacillus pseudomycoides]
MGIVLSLQNKLLCPKTKKVNLIIMNKCGVKNVIMGVLGVQRDTRISAEPLFRNLRENKKRYCHILKSVI